MVLARTKKEILNPVKIVLVLVYLEKGHEPGSKMGVTCPEKVLSEVLAAVRHFPDLLGMEILVARYLQLEMIKRTLRSPVWVQALVAEGDWG